MSYLHGIKIDVTSDGKREIREARTSVIGIVGTAETGEDNKPVLIESFKKAVKTFGAPPVLQDNGQEKIDELTDEISDIDEKISKETDTKAKTALKKNKKEKTDALKEIKSSEKAESNYCLVRALEAIYAHGSCLCVCVKVAGSSYPDAIKSLLNAKALTDYKPNIILAPTMGHDKSVREALYTVGKELNGVVLFNSPKDKKSDDAIADVKEYANEKGYNVFYTYGYATGTGNIGELCLASFVAGLMCKNDSDNGFWTSPSNKVFSGIKSLSNPVSYSMAENSETNRLNEVGIAVCIREGGFRLWGSRTLGKDGSVDHLKFLNVLRTSLAIKETIQKSLVWASDSNIGSALIEQVIENISGYLRTLRQRGAIIDGNAWADDDNTPEDIANGKLKISFDYSPVFPAESILIKQVLTVDYLNQLIK